MATDNHLDIQSFSPPEDNRLYTELFRIHREIHGLSNNLDDLPKLLEIQKSIICAILDAESEIRCAKKLSVSPKEWQYIRYNFMCLGDCLAFLYIDRFSLKQTYFDVNTTMPKQGGGFILDKAGHKEEMFLLESAIAHNVPAVLCDITNVLRYGDICLLGGGDPVPIEVKSSKIKDRRGKRQKGKLQKLANFLESDRAHNFRGLPGTTIRTNISQPPELYTAELQSAVEKALSVGSTSFDVNECLRVIVITEENQNYEELFGEIKSSRVLANSVNEIKTHMQWGCYYPYALSFSNPRFYEGFVRGEIHIFTFLDIEAFEKKLSAKGVSLAVEATEHDISCLMQFPKLPNGDQGPVFIIGEHMMCRIWTDFISPSWIVNNSIASVENSIEVMREELSSAAQIK